MRNREQEGYIFKRNGVWVLRYRITVNQGGTLKSVQKAKVLAPVDSNHKTKASVRSLADDVLDVVNKYRTEPATVVTVGDFVTRVYLPFVKAQKRPSTERGYRDTWHDHVEARAGSVLLRDVRTCDVQRWLETISAEDRTKSDEPLRHRTLQHIKSLISGIFAHAKRQGYFDGENPVRDTAIPPARKAGETYAYSLDEIIAMLTALPEPAATIVATAAFTGVRRGELRGMRWEDYRNGAIYIEKSMWGSHTTEPKTSASRAPIPVIPELAVMLDSHRRRQGNPSSGPIFTATNGKPFEPNNLLGRVIRPVLEADTSLPSWHGWHAFRRGLGTNLHDLGVDDKTNSTLLRHSNVAVTQAYYIKTLPSQSLEAMSRLSALLCSKRAQDEDVQLAAVVN